MKQSVLFEQYGEFDVENVTNGQIIQIFNFKYWYMAYINAATLILNQTNLSYRVSANVLKGKIQRTVLKNIFPF